jgi:AcrR family transcriptional regulator
VLYHFAKKEQLYAAVHAGIGEPLERDLRAGLELHADPEDGLDAAAETIAAWAEREPDRVRLLLRELLDNEARVARAARLPLAPVLELLADFAARGARAGVFRADVPPETLVLSLVGAVSYVVVARPTVRRIVGPDRSRRLASSFSRDAVVLARRAFGLPEARAGARSPEPGVSPKKEPSHGSRTRDRAHPPRPRARRGADDRS